MGTWGPNSFDNDAALDWAERYRDAGLPLAAETVKTALDAYLSDDGLAADLACEGVAAVEAICLAMGRGSNPAIEALKDAPDSDPLEAAKLTQDCTHLIMSVAGGSELADLWKDADHDDREAWHESLRDIQSRIQGPATAPKKAAKQSPPSKGKHAPTDVKIEDMFVDLRNAIGGIEYDIAMLKLDVEEKFAQLSRKLEKLG